MTSGLSALEIPVLFCTEKTTPSAPSGLEPQRRRFPRPTCRWCSCRSVDISGTSAGKRLGKRWSLFSMLSLVRASSSRYLEYAVKPGERIEDSIQGG